MPRPVKFIFVFAILTLLIIGTAAFILGLTTEDAFFLGGFASILSTLFMLISAVIAQDDATPKELPNP